MPLGPLPVREGPRGPAQLDVCLHEADANVQVWMLCLDGHHLAPVIRVEQPLGLNDDAVRQHEVRGVDRGDRVRQGQRLVSEGQPPLLEAGRY